MEYSCKFRLYPNGEQINLIERTFGCGRYVYNYYLAKRQDVYKATGKTLNYFVLSEMSLNLAVLESQSGIVAQLSNKRNTSN